MRLLFYVEAGEAVTGVARGADQCASYLTEAKNWSPAWSPHPARNPLAGRDGVAREHERSRGNSSDEVFHLSLCALRPITNKQWR
jgi:hypothetical protein